MVEIIKDNVGIEVASDHNIDKQAIADATNHWLKVLEADANTEIIRTDIVEFVRTWKVTELHPK